MSLRVFKYPDVTPMKNGHHKNVDSNEGSKSPLTRRGARRPNNHNKDPVIDVGKSYEGVTAAKSVTFKEELVPKVCSSVSNKAANCLVPNTAWSKKAEMLDVEEQVFPTRECRHIYKQSGNENLLGNDFGPTSIKTPLKRKSAISSHKWKPSESLKVRFSEYVKVNEFENDSSNEMTEYECMKEKAILSMCLEDDNNNEGDCGDASQAPAWDMASAMFSATRRLAMFARDSLTYKRGQKKENDLTRRYAIDGITPRGESDLADANGNPYENQAPVVEEVIVPTFIDWERTVAGKNKTRQKAIEEHITRTESKEELCYLSRSQTVEDITVTPGKVNYRPKETVQKVRGDKTDPFQFFEVEHEACHVLKARVLRGRNISNGRLQDILDTPDPYVVIHIKAAPDGRKATRHIDNETNPEWNEELTYLLPTEEGIRIVAEISLMEANYSVDSVMGSVEFDIGNIPQDKTVLKTFSFNETSEVDIEFRKEIKGQSDLRCSLALCDQEKDFRKDRRRSVFVAMRQLMESNGRTIGPRKIRETPTIAVIGSGGGFRAMTGYAGAIKALHDSGVLSCCTYVTGLSGSSWYLSTLYADENFPEKGTDSANASLRKNIENSPFWLLRPECLMRYSQRLHSKMKSGQPVTFTDFFGMLIGQTLLGPEKMNEAKLSDFHEKIKNGQAPMPLMTCLHVKPKTSAMTFHDWVEFTPYEIGMAKYGTFMSTKNFGSKFFMGVLAKEFDESPLHFLMGVWGSAFSILFNRLVEKSKGLKNNSKSEDFRAEMEQELTNSINSSSLSKDDESDSEYESDFEDAVDEPQPPAATPRRDTWFGTPSPVTAAKKQENEKRPSVFQSIWNWTTGGAQHSIDESEDSVQEKRKSKRSVGFFKSIIGSVFGTEFLESREYRAGKILNYMRGVSLNNTYPLSPFTPLYAQATIAEDGEFQQIHEPIEVKRKKVHLVDAGLTFNSPYPSMLRPQRTIDLILSFDFSSRPSEHSQPFKEILLAEKWARMHHLPFPKIDRSVFEREGMKECYVFKDQDNDRAPTILHFVLCNIQFRKFIKPGVPRESGDRRGEFNIFDNPKKPYSTFNFQYSNDSFDRLHDLVEFNTLLHIDTILDEIHSSINLRRHSTVRGSITLNDIRKSIHLSDKNKRTLESTILNSGGSSLMLE